VCRHGGTPAHFGAAAAGPPPPEAGVTRGAERPSSAVTTTHRRALLAQGRAAARRPLCLASVAPPRRQGGGSGPATRPLTAWAGSAELRTTSPPRRCRTPLGGATGKPVLGRGGLRSACRAGRACASLGHGVGHLVTHIGGGLQRVRVRVSGEGEGEGEGENEGEW